MNPGLAASCCVDTFGFFICAVLLSNNNNNNNRPDIVVLEKEGRVSCPFDTRVAEKEMEKVDHFKDLKVEVQIKI